MRESPKKKKRRRVETSCGNYALQTARAQIVIIVTTGPEVEGKQKNGKRSVFVLIR
jgi:hypothetical protein